jgi:hypothetical protein
MFGKKEKSTTENQPVITARIDTMPAAFYGGADPVIYHDPSEKIKTPSPQTAVPVVAAPLPLKKPIAPPLRQPAAPSDSSVKEKTALQKPLPKSPSNSKRNIFIGVFIVILLIALGIVYFAFFAKPPASDLPLPSVSKTTNFDPSPVLTPVLVTTTVPVELATSTVSSTPVLRGGGSLTLPHIAYAPAKDDDSDSLTNSEENIFQTDPELYDTDSDGYYDGLEVANLYNPKGIAPQKIIDSGLVKEYINPTYQYRFYYPSSWRVDPVADDFKDILVSGDSGDYMEIRVFPKDAQLSFASWFGVTLPGESFSSLNNFQNRFQVNGYKRTDGQVGFFETPTAIYSVVYFYGEQEKNAFPHVMNVLLQSFRMNKNGFELPLQVILPGVVSSTPLPATSTVSSPVSTTSSSIPVSTEIFSSSTTNSEVNF